MSRTEIICWIVGGLFAIALVLGDARRRRARKPHRGVPRVSNEDGISYIRFN